MSFNSSRGETLETPVALFIYRRPELTKKVFLSIRQARPKKLYVVADGPASESEARFCEDAMAAVMNHLDWDCHTETLFESGHLGSRRRVISGLQWIFSKEERLIIVEDDCLPSQSFFWYCQELLDFYRHEPRVTSISGSNLGFRDPNKKQSYRFSKFMNMWGWATWKRAFEAVGFHEASQDGNLPMESLEKYIGSQDFCRTLGYDKMWIRYWQGEFKKMRDGQVDAWDYQWVLSNLRFGGLAVSPAVNMVQNLGWGQGATHTRDPKYFLSTIRAEEGLLPLMHPKCIRDHKSYDSYIKSAWCRLKPPGRVRGFLDRLACCLGGAKSP